MTFLKAGPTILRVGEAAESSALAHFDRVGRNHMAVRLRSTPKTEVKLNSLLGAGISTHFLATAIQPA